MPKAGEERREDAKQFPDLPALHIRYRVSEILHVRNSGSSRVTTQSPDSKRLWKGIPLPPAEEAAGKVHPESPGGPWQLKELAGLEKEPGREQAGEALQL